MSNPDTSNNIINRNETKLRGSNTFWRKNLHVLPKLTVMKNDDHAVFVREERDIAKILAPTVQMSHINYNGVKVYFKQYVIIDTEFEGFIHLLTLQ